MRAMTGETTSIAANLGALKARIAELAIAAGRKPEDVRLIAVSKTHPRAAIEAAVTAGQFEFGENTVQDALGKIPHFAGRDLTWHFIGHLQSNKAKFIPGNFQWLHSLDSAALAPRLSRAAVEKGVTVKSLIEVNITRDPAKHGLAPDSVFPLIEELLKQPLPGIDLRGLMCIGPHPATEPEIRAAFASLRKLRDESQVRFGLPAFTELSMGMSGDYTEAIREGSTMVRVGTAIFGERDYHPPHRV
jgi:pyridoxal phosphate enzyme (YggS family)